MGATWGAGDRVSSVPGRSIAGRAGAASRGIASAGASMSRDAGTPIGMADGATGSNSDATRGVAIGAACRLRAASVLR